MHIKTFIAAAVVALTAACSQAEQDPADVVEVPADGGTGGAGADVDGVEAQPRAVSEENPAKPAQ